MLEGKLKKAEHPAYLLRNSLVSASLEAAILNAKYVNAMPLYRQEKEFERYGMNITRGEMTRWTILCAERYLSVFYDYLHQKLYEYHVLRADELCEALHNSSATVIPSVTAIPIATIIAIITIVKTHTINSFQYIICQNLGDVTFWKYNEREILFS